MKKSNSINSIIRASEVLKSLSKGLNRISDIAEELNLSKSTTHRLLNTLEKVNLVFQDPIRHRYYLGHQILSLSSNPLIAHQGLVTCAFEDVQYLQGLTEETVVIHIRTGLQRVCLEELPSSHNIKYTAGRGNIAPIYTGAAGKILLSELANDELDMLFKNIKLVKVATNTITNKIDLKKEIEKVRWQGYATSFGERVNGSACLSVPIKNYITPVALSILGPDNRFNPLTNKDILNKILKRAILISEKLKSFNMVEPDI